MKELIVSGDSWSFGSEIVDPLLSSDTDELSEKNDSYRLSHIWPNLLRDKLKFSELKNLSFPAISNDRIFRVLYNYLFKKYISNGIPLNNVFLIVQLTSFDRKDFYIDDSKSMGKWQTIWPNWNHDYGNYELNTFADSYSTSVYSDKENLNRYLNQIFNFQNFCKSYNIPYLITQGFYHTDYSPDITKWVDNPYINLFNNDTFCGANDELNKKYYEGSSELLIWKEVDKIRFMDKNKKTHSLHSIIKNKNLFKDMHPNEVGHKIIAEYIENYIKKYNLLSFN